MTLDLDQLRQIQGELHYKPITYAMLMECNDRIERLMEYLKIIEVADTVGFKFQPNPEFQKRIL